MDESRDPIYLNWFDPRNGVVIANMNDKRNDMSPDDERLFPSEIIWQSWCRVPHRQSIPVSNLRRRFGRAGARSLIASRFPSWVCGDYLAELVPGCSSPVNPSLDFPGFSLWRSLAKMEA